MMDSYTEQVLHRAEALQDAAWAACMLPKRHSGMLRAWIGALLAALMTLYPAVSAASSLL